VVASLRDCKITKYKQTVVVQVHMSTVKPFETVGGFIEGPRAVGFNASSMQSIFNFKEMEIPR
jgi:hypothetical protein